MSHVPQIVVCESCISELCLLSLAYVIEHVIFIPWNVEHVEC